jgi:CBS domain containing-hemolysin-like protein
VEQVVIAAVLGLAAVLVLIAANGLFVAAEFALVAVDRAQVERAAAAGDKRAAGVAAAVRRLSFHLSGAQLGITVTSLAVGFLAEPALAELISPALSAAGLPHGVTRPIAAVLGLLLATVAQMVLGELVPKNWAIARPLAVARRVAGSQRAFSSAARAPIGVLNALANRVVRAFGVEPAEELRSARSADELGFLVSASAEQGTLAPGTAALLDRSLRFGDRTAVDVMTPRVRVVTLAADATIADLLRTAESSGHSRFPVHRGDPDDVIGVVHLKQAFVVPADERAARPLAGAVTPVLRVPASLDCDALLTLLRRDGQQLAVVVDEYGGTAGIVTLEDLVEELVGEVADEHDRQRQPDVERLPDGTFLVSGLLRGDEVADRTGFTPPEGPYETLGGFVLAALGRVPSVGDTVEVDGWSLEVAAMDRRRVDRVRLRPPVQAAPDGAPGTSADGAPGGPG